VGTGSTERKSHLVFPVYQDPVRLEMAIAPTCQFAAERMIPVFHIERSSIAQGLELYSI
jgi:hypothetical protein